MAELPSPSAPPPPAQPSKVRMCLIWVFCSQKCAFSSNFWTEYFSSNLTISASYFPSFFWRKSIFFEEKKVLISDNLEKSNKRSQIQPKYVSQDLYADYMLLLLARAGSTPEAEKLWKMSDAPVRISFVFFLSLIKSRITTINRLYQF